MEEIKVLIGIAILIVTCIAFIALSIWCDNTKIKQRKEEKAEFKQDLLKDLRQEVFNDIVEYFRQSKDNND